jgi:DNA-directed RNA polymerase specialized sigma24 family protein
MNPEQTGAAFQTTRWSLIGRLRDGPAGERRQLLDTLIELYWPPVFAYVRRGMNRDEAAETTQGFFSDVVLSRELFQSAEKPKGHLRTLLLTALKRFIVDQGRRAGACGRGGRAAHVSIECLDREEKFLATSLPERPEDAFGRRWASRLVELAASRCREHFRGSDKDRNWEAFEARILLPMTSMVAPVPYAQLAERLGFSTRKDAAAAVKYVRKRFQMVLRGVVADTVVDGVNPDDEYRDIIAILS